MKENVIISLADANYFELLNDLIDSIKRFNESNEIAICVLDAGLKDNQKNILINKVDEIKKAKWDIEVPSYKVKDKLINNSSFTILDAMEKLELVKSRSETKRLIKSNGIKVNEKNYNENDFSLSNYKVKGEIKINVGKKKVGFIKIIK